MNAIKLPVKAYKGFDGQWLVNDAKSRLCQSLTELQANQIALALNLHDDMLAELKSVRDGTIHRNKIINLISFAEGK